MDWTDNCVDHLIGGGSLNLVGLDGSGRSRGLRMIVHALDPSDWTHLLWSPIDLATMHRREISAAIDTLCDDDRYPVLLIDDFGELLMTPSGPWLERMLFSRVFEAHNHDRPSLRCVVVTHPRDHEIVGPGSGLRERARYVQPPPRDPAAQELADFGCTNAEELLLLTGHNNHLLGVSGETPNARRGLAKSKAQEWLPRWIGQLDTGHQSRLGAILDRGHPPQWRHDDADPSLTPIVVAKRSDNAPRCAVTSSIAVEDLRRLLVGQPWPERDLKASANRFSARCGNDPAPLWVDNYLSDTSLLDFTKLVEFLKVILSNLPRVAYIRILSRNWVDGRRVYASDILTALQQAGISQEHKNRLHWRLYDQRNNVNLHRRELILSTRRAAFSLPPARIVIGQDLASNETDAAVALASSAPASTAWKRGVTVIGTGLSPN
ncbi:MAG: hypothetical protein OXH43_08070 [Acidimicrobiaceae bacterium]|nr:hypothetical protein [Acidimicrobiaceae bacterium]